MRQSSIESLLVRVSPPFALVNAVATRARQLIRGDIPAIETNTRNPVLIAMEELAVGRLHVTSRTASDEPTKGTRAAPQHDVADRPGEAPEDEPVAIVTAG